MGSKLWNLFRKEISLLTVFAFLYPLLLLMRAVLFGVTWGMPGIAFGIILLYAGYIVAGLITKKKQNFTRLFITYLSVFIISTVFAIIYWGFIPGNKYLPTRLNSYLSSKVVEILNIIFESLCIFILYFAGIRGRFNSYDSVITGKKLVFGSIVLIVSLIFIQYYKEVGYLKNTIYVFTYIFIILSLLIRNQENLDRTFIKKHIDLSTVPKNIRNYNSVFVTILFLIIIAIFNIQELTNFIVTIIKNTPKFLILAFFKFLELLSKLYPVSEGQVDQGGGRDSFLGLPEGGEENPIAALLSRIFYFIILAGALGFVIWKLPAILRVIGRKLGKLIKIVAEFFRKLFVIQENNLEKETDYIDEVMIIKPQVNADSEKDKEKKIRRIGGKAWKNSDYIKRIRFMYKLIVNYIKNYGIDIKKSDTTGEIYIKASRIDGIKDDLNYATNVYNKVRYGKKVPDEAEYSKFEEFFTDMVNILKRKQ
ncbi:MAG TPA: hypothetical protein GXX37_05510 [Clostridiaceae bacterium]|nr:hypothetical protein [Clostridiaceae bacterium]